MSNIQYQIENRRVIISTGGKCPLGCRYCYTYSPKFVGFPKRKASQILNDLKSYKDQFDTIQLGYDTELFIPENEKEALALIEGLSVWGKNISLSTRMTLKTEIIDKLQEIYLSMKKTKNHLVIFMSLIGFETARKLEPNAPDPLERIETLRAIYKKEIPCFVFIRPLLPIVSDEELNQLFKETKNICNGYVVGKVYYDRDSFETKFGVSVSDKNKMSWGLDRREWNIHIDKRISSLVTESHIFSSSLEAISSLN